MVVAVIAILAAIAYPSYQNSLKKERRSTAESYLMDIAQREQQYLLDQRSYASSEATLGLSTPDDVSPYYTIGITAPAAVPPTFTASAVPVTGSLQDGDGTLSITEANVKSPAGYW